MRVGPEPLDECYHELDALLHSYFDTTVAKRDMPALNMNWLAYIRLSNEGQLVLLTAREDDNGSNKLVGFVMYHVYPHLHHVGTVNAACDILAVDKEMRRKRIGSTLMHAAEPILKSMGARYITHQFRTCYNEKPLFPKVGYRLIERGYLKELK